MCKERKGLGGPAQAPAATAVQCSYTECMRSFSYFSVQLQECRPFARHKGTSVRMLWNSPSLPARCAHLYPRMVALPLIALFHRPHLPRPHTHACLHSVGIRLMHPTSCDSTPVNSSLLFSPGATQPSLPVPCCGELLHVYIPDSSLTPPLTTMGPWRKQKTGRGRGRAELDVERHRACEATQVHSCHCSRAALQRNKKELQP